MPFLIFAAVPVVIVAGLLVRRATKPRPTWQEANAAEYRRRKALRDRQAERVQRDRKA